MGFDRIPIFYSGWLRNALANRRRDDELVGGLMDVRNDHRDVAESLTKHIEKYDREGLREGREEVLESFRRARTHCEAVAAEADRAISTLQTF
jgi:hypothetical protein